VFNGYVRVKKTTLKQFCWTTQNDYWPKCRYKLKKNEINKHVSGTIQAFRTNKKTVFWITVTNNEKVNTKVKWNHLLKTCRQHTNIFSNTVKPKSLLQASKLTSLCRQAQSTGHFIKMHFIQVLSHTKNCIHKKIFQCRKHRKILQRKPTSSKTVQKLAHLHKCHSSTKVVCVEKLRNTKKMWRHSARLYKKTLGIKRDYEAVICRYSTLADDNKNSIK